MELFLEFAAQQWILMAALAVSIGMLIAHEGRKSGPALSPQQAITLVNREDGVFVDLRDAAAFKQGHIVEARHIPLAKLTERRAELDAFKDKPVILVCKMGQQAATAGKQLREAGFSQVYKMAGGMMEWSSLQLPTVTK
ncbi:MAG: rhodanese-like domain-containing protein [Congregibacter sp.]|nr:rhodanese-like domain-containing protein [Congregibacter sp.]MDP5069666.1 rhodanese-like domain-containing protein [Congregibacter sp.]